MSHETLSLTVPNAQTDHWLIQRTQFASRELDDCIELNENKMGGVPLLKGSRISVAQVLAEISEGHSAAEVALDFDLDVSLVQRLVQGLAVCFDRPVAR